MIVLAVVLEQAQQRLQSRLCERHVMTARIAHGAAPNGGLQQTRVNAPVPQTGPQMNSRKTPGKGRIMFRHMPSRMSALLVPIAAAALALATAACGSGSG